MVIKTSDKRVAEVEINPGEKVLTDARSALDLAMTIVYTHHVNRIVIPKEAITDEFFILSSGLAGEILQKYVNYRVKLAIYGDFSRYTSKPLHDFIYESNQGHDVFFAATKAEAIERLTRTHSEEDGK